MTNSDFRIQTSFFTHPKRRKLERRLDKSAVLCLIELWCFTASNKPDGVLTDMSIEDIEIAAGWDGKDGELLSTLVSVRFLDKLTDAYRIHDWTDHNPYAARAEERSLWAIEQNARRWGAEKYGLTGTALDKFVTDRLNKTSDTDSATDSATDRISSDTDSSSPILSNSPPPPTPPEGNLLPSKNDGDERLLLSENKRKIKDTFFQLYQQEFGNKPKWGKVENKRVKELLEQLDSDAVRISNALIKAYRCYDEFIMDKRASFITLTSSAMFPQIDVLDNEGDPPSIQQ